MAMKRKSSKSAARKSAKKTRASLHPKRAAARKTLRRAAPAGSFVTPPGFVRSGGGLLVPLPEKVVPAGKLKKGIGDAKRYVEDMLTDFIQAMGEDYEVAEIELSASFSADGKFLGFGVGGDASIKLKIRPS